MPTFSDTSGSASPVFGIRSEVYERRWELIWMSKDDIETLEARIADKSLFHSIGLVCISGAIPLGLEKLIDYWGHREATDLAIIIICLVAVVAGLASLSLAQKRDEKVQKFKERLF